MSQPLPDQSARGKFTHVCLDCGALGTAGGYHDHGYENAGDTIPLSALPAVLRSFQAIENERDELRAEVEALKAEALDVCGITYGMLTAGIVDDHDRIMRAANELAEFGRRLTGAAPPLDEQAAS